MKKNLLIALALCVALNVAAQPGGGPQQRPDQGQASNPPKMENPAQMKAEMMKAELGLTDKQYKKVLNVFKQEQNSLHPSNNGMPGGGPGGMGGPGGGPGGMPGGMGGPGGGMGGPGGGMPGGPGMGQGEMPQGLPPGMSRLSDEEMEKILAKKEKQLRKILTPEQFDKWAKDHPEEFTLMDQNWDTFGLPADYLPR